LLSAMRWM